MSGTTLRAERVSYRVAGRALVEDISLTLGPGEVLACVGPNGAGKSTLLRLLCGDLRPGAGTVTLDGRPLADYSPRELALRRAVLPQHSVVQFAFRVRDVVLMGRAPRAQRGRAAAAADWALVNDAMRRTDTASLAHRVITTLSGGEQQRVALARVLAQDAPVLLLDEPTAALDIRHQEVVLRVAREAAASGGAVLAVLHDLNLAAAYADRVAVLDNGRLAALGPPHAVLSGDLLSRVYRHPIVVTPHPVTGAPLVMADRAQTTHIADGQPSSAPPIGVH